MTKNLINGKESKATTKLDDTKIIIEDWWLKPTRIRGIVRDDPATNQPYADVKYVGDDLRLVGTEKQIDDFFNYMLAKEGLQIKDSWNVSDDLTEKELEKAHREYKENGNKLKVYNLR